MLAEDEIMEVDIYDFEPEAKRQSSIATTATTATTPSSILTNSTRPTSSHSAMETDEDWDDACSSGTDWTTPRVRILHLLTSAIRGDDIPA